MRAPGAAFRNSCDVFITENICSGNSHAARNNVMVMVNKPVSVAQAAGADPPPLKLTNRQNPSLQ